MYKRDIIYKVGVDEISKRGFFNTKVADIAQAANLSIGTFYNYFDDKNDFLYCIYLDLTTRLYNQLKIISSKNLTEIDKIALYIEALLKEISINTNTYRVYITERYYLPKILDDKKLSILNKINFDIEGILENIILEGQQKRLIKEIEPNLIIIMIQSLTLAELYNKESTENLEANDMNTEDMKLFILDAIKL